MSLRLRRIVICGIVALALGGLIACEKTEPDTEERGAIEASVKGYLNALAEAYSDLNTTPLEGWASPQEIAAVRKLLKGLVSTGDRVESSLRGVEFESLEIFREVNATVTLVEIWDIVRVDAFSGREKGDNLGSVQNTILQMRLVDDRWMVTARRVIGDGSKPRWNVTTPTPNVPKGGHQ